MKNVKIVVLGGSGVATPELAAALAEVPGRTRPIDLVLVGRSKEKLDLVAGIAHLMADRPPLIRISTQTDVEKALEGAEIVLNQIRVGGLEARSFDETFPQAFGLPGEETVGPGGFANASRTIPVVLEYAQMIERICPEATLLTFANPSSLVQLAITSTTRVKTIGLCDGPVTLIGSVAAALGTQAEALVADYVGMHHFGWITGLWKDGVDVFPLAMDRVGKIAPDVDEAIPPALGAIPGPYHNYFFHSDRMWARKQGQRARAEELLDLQDELLDEFADALARGVKPAGLLKRKARWYRAIIAPVMLALAESRTGKFIVNLVNHGAIPWLPDAAIVELPTWFEHKCFRPVAVNEVPSAVKALIQKNCAYEMLAVEAIIERDREKALSALLLNPMIHTYEQARQTLEKAWGWKPIVKGA